jgi:hypothetical protein
VPVLGLVVVFVAVAGLTARHFYRLPTTSAPTVVLPSGTATASPATSSTNVTLTDDAYASPWQNKVQVLLQNYFDAINQHLYPQWRASVTANRAQQEPESQFARDFRSTHDSDIVVYRIDRTPAQGLLVMVAFRSRQATTDAPVDFPYACIQWQVVWPLAPVADGYRVGPGSTGATPLRQKC